ncbi:MAG: transporter related [Acidimicrobiales bacterium]|nr:transporter related [Acidimicrobiales bacterium]
MAGSGVELAGISVSFQGVRALAGVDLHVAAEGVTGLIGPNGSGKTTVFNVVSGMIRPGSGALRWEGQRINRWSMPRRVRAGLVRTFQEPAVFASMTVREAFAFVERTTARHHGAGSTSAGLRDELIEVTRLGSCWDSPASELAHGQKRLLGVSLAMLAAPRLLMLDEPAAGMSPAELDLLGDAIRTVRDLGVAIWIVEHHMDFLFGIADYIDVLNAGTLIASGTADEVRQSAEVISVYLGGEHV